MDIADVQYSERATDGGIPTEDQIPVSVIGGFLHRRGNEPIDEVGIPTRLHYWLLATFAYGIGASSLIISFTDIGRYQATFVIRMICISGIILAPLLILLGRARSYRFDARIFHVALAFATLATFSCHQVMQSGQAPFQIFYVVGAIGAAFYLPLRQAVPHIVLSVSALLTMGAMLPQPEAILRSLILSTFVICCSLMIEAIRRRLAFTVMLNHTLAECDGLTGAYNLRSFERRMADEVARAGRGRGEFALIEFDLDNFKQVNDLYDHSTGDEILIATTDAIQSAFGTADLLVRRGGDEFVVVAPGSAKRDLDTAIRLATERVAWARHEICGDVTPTVTCAMAEYRRGDTAEDVYRRADEALHDAKQSASGRRGHESAFSEDEITYCPTPETQEIRELRERRVDGVELSSDPIIGARRVIWKMAAGAILAIAVSVNACALLNVTDLNFSSRSIVLSLFWSVVFAPIVYRMSSRRSQPEYLLHGLGIIALVMVTFGCAIAGRQAPALVESYLLIVLAIAAILSARATVVYLTITMGLYATILIASDYPMVEVQMVNTVMLIGLSAVLLSFTRARTITAAREKLALAHSDVLTDLPNLRRLSDRLTDEISRCRSTGEPLAMLMLDLDHFKLVNDLFSHTVGDQVLVAVADALKQTARSTDMPARRGGDEFAVILTGTDAREATTTRDRVGAAIAEARGRVCPDVTPTASVAWVAWRNGESADDFLARADAALNLEKKARRREQELVI